MLGLHLADLHLGKRLKEFSLLEEQRDVLEQVVAYCEKYMVSFVILAGDIFDKGIPPVEALEIFDEFLGKLSKMNVEVLVLGGNHDSAERLGFLRSFLKHHHIHLVTQYQGEVEKIELVKDGEKVCFYMLPFVKPADVRRYLPEEERIAITSYHDAVKVALDKTALEADSVNILVAHQFVTGADRCESEEISVGGLDNVSAEAMEAFDYVALGHIHSPQYIKDHPNMRYSGTPLKYSFSECGQTKSMTVLDVKDDKVAISTEPFKVLRELYMLRGTFAELTASSMVEQYHDAYLHITLTDEEEILNVLSDMRTLYPHLCYLTFDNSRTRPLNQNVEVAVEKSPLELISSFFEQRCGHAMSEEQQQLLQDLLEKVQVEK